MKAPSLALLVIAGLLLGGAGALAQTPSPDDLAMSPPLGYEDGHAYAPRVLRQAGRLIEDTRYAVQNPDLKGTTCFGIAWEELYHAGQDLYRADGESTAGAEVTAVADGTVVYADPDLNYPGLAVIIEHALPDDEVLYSVYAHLDDNSLEVSEGQTVHRGDLLGEVMYIAYSGRFPEQHPSGDDSHLHFELRRFQSARRIYTDYPACNGLIVGRGYTYPAEPGDFPAPGQGYVDPEEWLPRE
jgi:murein DD-endopeptidase MepM/ murein hydrolase activator NlpD